MRTWAICLWLSFTYVAMGADTSGTPQADQGVRRLEQAYSTYRETGDGVSNLLATAMAVLSAREQTPETEDAVLKLMAGVVDGFALNVHEGGTNAYYATELDSIHELARLRFLREVAADPIPAYRHLLDFYGKFNEVEAAYIAHTNALRQMTDDYHSRRRYLSYEQHMDARRQHLKRVNELVRLGQFERSVLRNVTHFWPDFDFNTVTSEKALKSLPAEKRKAIVEEIKRLTGVTPRGGEPPPPMTNEE